MRSESQDFWKRNENLIRDSPHLHFQQWFDIPLCDAGGVLIVMGISALSSSVTQWQPINGNFYVNNHVQ